MGLFISGQSGGGERGRGSAWNESVFRDQEGTKTHPSNSNYLWKTTRPGRLNEYLKGLSVILSFFSPLIFFVGGWVGRWRSYNYCYYCLSFYLFFVTLGQSTTICFRLLRLILTLYTTEEPGTYRPCLAAPWTVFEPCIYITLQCSLGPTGLVLQLRGKFLNITLHYNGAWDLPDLSWSSEGSFWTLHYTGAWDLLSMACSALSSFWALHLHYITLEPGNYRPYSAASWAASEHYITLEPGNYRP